MALTLMWILSLKMAFTLIAFFSLKITLTVMVLTLMIFFPLRMMFTVMAMTLMAFSKFLRMAFIYYEPDHDGIFILQNGICGAGPGLDGVFKILENGIDGDGPDLDGVFILENGVDRDGPGPPLQDLHNGKAVVILSNLLLPHLSI